FFFQAEDGIRDATVTGVQTCALPICDKRDSHLSLLSLWSQEVHDSPLVGPLCGLHGGQHEHTPPTVQRWKELFGGSCCLWVGSRSEERRVGKECSCGWAQGVEQERAA